MLLGGDPVQPLRTAHPVHRVLTTGGRAYEPESRLLLVSLTVLAGALAGLAGFIDLSRFGSSALAGHGNDALAAVTAVVIGGTLLEGGFISIIGTLWGAGLGRPPAALVISASSSGNSSSSAWSSWWPLCWTG